MAVYGFIGYGFSLQTVAVITTICFQSNKHNMSICTYICIYSDNTLK